MGFMMKDLLNNRFPTNEMEKGSVGVVQNVRIPSFFIKILIESNRDHNFRLNSYEF